jgi:protein-disulfide isomerase
MTLAVPPRARLALLAAPLLLAWAGRESRAAEVQERVLGNADAPVTIIEYASLTCPHCATFHVETLPALKQRYIDPGKAKLIFRDFPLDQVALQAAVLAHCAGDQRYFAFLDAMFANQATWARASDPVAALKQLARLGGLPEDQANACLADRSMQDAVLQSRLTGEQEFEVSATPTIIVNGRKVEGAHDIDSLAQAIDAAS